MAPTRPRMGALAASVVVAIGCGDRAATPTPPPVVQGGLAQPPPMPMGIAASAIAPVAPAVAAAAARLERAFRDDDRAAATGLLTPWPLWLDGAWRSAQERGEALTVTATGPGIADGDAMIAELQLAFGDSRWLVDVRISGGSIQLWPFVPPARLAGVTGAIWLDPAWSRIRGTLTLTPAAASGLATLSLPVDPRDPTTRLTVVQAGRPRATCAQSEGVWLQVDSAAPLELQFEGRLRNPAVATGVDGLAHAWVSHLVPDAGGQALSVDVIVAVPASYDLVVAGGVPTPTSPGWRAQTVRGEVTALAAWAGPHDGSRAVTTVRHGGVTLDLVGTTAERADAADEVARALEAFAPLGPPVIRRATLVVTPTEFGTQAGELAGELIWVAVDRGRNVLPHELAHLWFLPIRRPGFAGDRETAARWWESLAEYIAGWALTPDDAERQRVARARGTMQVPAPEHAALAVWSGRSDRLSYGYGAQLLAMLEDRVGRRAMARWAAAVAAAVPAGETSWDTLRALAERELGTDAAAWLGAWLERTAPVTVALEDVVVADGRVRGTIVRHQAAPPFRLEVWLQGRTSTSTTHRVEIAAPRTPFDLPAPEELFLVALGTDGLAPIRGDCPGEPTCRLQVALEVGDSSSWGFMREVLPRERSELVGGEAVVAWIQDALARLTVSPPHPPPADWIPVRAVSSPWTQASRDDAFARAPLRARASSSPKRDPLRAWRQNRFIQPGVTFAFAVDDVLVGDEHSVLGLIPTGDQRALAGLVQRPPGRAPATTGRDDRFGSEEARGKTAREGLPWDALRRDRTRGAIATVWIDPRRGWVDATTVLEVDTVAGHPIVLEALALGREPAAKRAVVDVLVDGEPRPWQVRDRVLVVLPDGPGRHRVTVRIAGSLSEILEEHAGHGGARFGAVVPMMPGQAPPTTVTLYAPPSYQVALPGPASAVPAPEGWRGHRWTGVGRRVDAVLVPATATTRSIRAGALQISLAADGADDPAIESTLVAAAAALAPIAPAPAPAVDAFVLDLAADPLVAPTRPAPPWLPLPRAASNDGVAATRAAQGATLAAWWLGGVDGHEPCTWRAAAALLLGTWPLAEADAREIRAAWRARATAPLPFRLSYPGPLVDFDGAMCARGALTLAGLEARIGRAGVATMIRALLARRDQLTSWRDLPPLAGDGEAWLSARIDEPWPPALGLGAVAIGRGEVTATLERRGRDDEVDDFTGPVVIAAFVGPREVARVEVDVTGPSTPVHLATAEPVTTLVIDPDNRQAIRRGPHPVRATVAAVTAP